MLSFYDNEDEGGSQLEFLMVGGSIDGQYRDIKGYMYYVPCLKDNGRYYAEIYRKKCINEHRVNEYYVFAYSGTTLPESVMVADALGSHKNIGNSESEFQKNLKTYVERARNYFTRIEDLKK